MRDYPHIYSQRDPQWATQRLGTVDGATIGQYGCILTCHAMKAGYYGHEIQPNALDDIYTNRNLYISGDLVSDADLTAVFTDIQLVESRNFIGIPADMQYLKEKASDPTLTVTIEVDFDHDPNDGIQTHFVELHDFDGTTLTIYDPWYGTADDFTIHYGTDPVTTIQKFAVYKGVPTTGNVSVPSDEFTKLVTNSTANDAVCDILGLPRDVGKDAEVSTITKLKADKASAEQTIINLNKQIPTLEGQISTLQNQITDLNQKLQIAQDASVHTDTGLNYKDLYTQAESDLLDTRKQLADAQKKYNQAMGQYSNNSPYLIDKWQLFRITLARLFGFASGGKSGTTT